MAVTPLEIMMKSLSGNGASVEFKQKMPDGSLEGTSEKQMSLLNTRARMATTAQGLQNFSPEEKTEWAVEMKDYANELYKNGLFAEAMEKYVESLTASDFGSSGSLVGNIDILVVPCLCNLAACTIQLQQWSKAYKFSEQVLLLRPTCRKAHMRQGIALFQVGEHTKAIEALKRALEQDLCVTPELNDAQQVASNHMQITENDRRRIEVMISKARKCLKEQRDAHERTKAALRKEFSGSSDKNLVVFSSESQKPVASSPKPLVNIWAYIGSLIEFLANMVRTWYLQYKRDQQQQKSNKNQSGSGAKTKVS